MMDRGGKLAATGIHQLGSWAVGRVLSMLEFAVIDILLFISHVFSLYLFVKRVTTTVIHLGGCCWKGGRGSLWEILAVVVCPAWAMAIWSKQGPRRPVHPVEEEG